ncbi:Dehydrogenase/reductase SDR member 11 [Homalodisca vitripennis]|nr:Dehydrogenase/reductase SDR member 11 [Homalodisca vitripennis]
MDQWKGKVAIVTGASAGIGAAIAQALVHHGMVVVGLARRQEKMQAIADELAKANEPGKLYAVKVDLKSEEDILAAFEWVDKELGGADVLVNNAAYLKASFLKDGKSEDWRSMIDINVLSVCICTREYLKSMERRQNQHGHIFIINSVAGHSVEVSIAGVYCGTKHAVRAISQCLRRELADKNSTIKVTIKEESFATLKTSGRGLERISKTRHCKNVHTISPGLTKTEATLRHLAHLGLQKALEVTDVTQALVDVLTSSPVTQICEVILTPIPNMSVY